LHSGFLASARSTPDAPALRHADRTWSYSELEDTARRWAAAIVGELGRPATRVAVFGVRSEVSYAGTLASLFSGAAFVPLSPEMPADRTRRMLEAAGVDAVIVDAEARPMLAEVLGAGDRSLPVLDPDGDGRGMPHGVRAIDARALGSIAPLEAIPDVASDATAYLLFTSGSTGKPKGVPISHANVAHFLDVNLARYSLSPEDRLSQTFQQTFDLSVFDLFMAWGSGACLTVPEPIDLVSPFDYVARNDVTVWFSVPSLATLLVRKGLLGRGSLPSLRWSLFCGEALPVATARAWQAAAPDSILENLYGPTECTIACTAYRWSGARSEAESINGLVPIGLPWDGVSALVGDGSVADAAPGATGELAIGGRQTFAGYWHAPEITERALFTRSGGLDDRPQTFYRTGDRVTVLPSGALAFLGRLDHQVKVLGHRVELGDVEAALRAQPGVTEAVAVATGTSGGSSDGLAAFVLGADVDPVALAESVRARLPTYMVPRTIRIVDEFPRNASGKVDRRSLAATLEA
jgi:amino acid adenylation domain-containing protein